MLLKYHHLLPDEVGRQNPWVLLKMLDGLGREGEEYESNDYLDMFYGREVG